VAEGYLVGYDEMFATRAAKDLTRMCGRPVEVQNLGREACYPLCAFHRVDEALALKPDLLVTIVTAQDLESIVPSEVSNLDKAIPMRWPSTTTPGNRASLSAEVHTLMATSRAVIVAKHFIFPLTYRHYFLADNDKMREADFLWTPFSPTQEKRLESFDLLLGEIAKKSDAAKVPLVLVLVPTLYQASALTLQDFPANLDPYALRERLEDISSRHGVQFVDVLDAFRRTPGSNHLFYIANGHLNGQGQALVSGPLVEQLTEGANPALPGCSVQRQLSASRDF